MKGSLIDEYFRTTCKPLWSMVDYYVEGTQMMSLARMRIFLHGIILLVDKTSRTLMLILCRYWSINFEMESTFKKHLVMIFQY